MGACTMATCRPLLLVLLLGASASAQMPTYGGVGRTPTPDEIRAWDISISPTGKELPPGHGTAKDGAPIYARRCAGCHGATLTGGRAPALRKADPAPAAAAVPVKAPAAPEGAGAAAAAERVVMARRSPFATTVWDYINRGMPLNREGTLSADEVYALTAFLLYKNDVIKEDDVIDAESLPKIKMPNRDGFAAPPEWRHGEARLKGYPY